jgi:hypothetical protein
MTQSELNRLVACATGEDVSTIAGRGFGIADPALVHHDPEPSRTRARIVNWDRLDAQRPALFARRQKRERVLA